ncbi:MAG: type I restriction enzyme HsdR N-terminal domain-containing protein [Muribaculaceae bacterium]|nr:type I restriction enzyme HsdR N-terminal domain-containing protein [Muribaculaceae bacterium]
MDFKDSVLQLSERIEKLKDNIQTEEATKNAFIMPMIAALGYDVFNPLEVVPELDCDLTKKKGEKIDYAIMKDGNAAMLIECKHWKQDLNLHNTQLKRYFVASNARFGILSNGIEYRFYTDLEKPNIMDEKPFMVVDMQNLSDIDIEQLKKFHKSYYNEDNILSTAQELKYTTELSNLLNAEFTSPSSDFVKFFTKQVYEGQVNQKIIEQFTPLIKKAITSIINETISDRLGLAIKSSKNETETIDVTQPQEKIESAPVLPEGVVYQSEDGLIVTTQEEIDSYLIVKAILRPVVDISRVHYRDAQSYFAILLDDNNRKPICRMILNKKTVKYIVLFGEDKAETKYAIESLDDIYNFTDQIRATVKRYDKK